MDDVILFVWVPWGREWEIGDHCAGSKSMGATYKVAVSWVRP